MREEQENKNEAGIENSYVDEKQDTQGKGGKKRKKRMVVMPVVVVVSLLSGICIGTYINASEKNKLQTQCEELKKKNKKLSENQERLEKDNVENKEENKNPDQSLTENDTELETIEMELQTVVVGNNLTIRQECDLYSVMSDMYENAKLDTIKKDEEVTVLGEMEDEQGTKWLHVLYNNQNGFIKYEYLQ